MPITRSWIIVSEFTRFRRVRLHKDALFGRVFNLWSLVVMHYIVYSQLISMNKGYKPVGKLFLVSVQLIKNLGVRDRNSL